MVDNPIQGMVGYADFVENELPGDWRSGLLRQEPAGDAPLTALTALMPSTSVSDPIYHWWTKDLFSQRAAVTGLFTDPAGVNAYAGGGVANDHLFIGCAQADAGQFRHGHQIALRYTEDPSLDVTAKIVGAPILQGANTKIPILLMEDDNNSKIAGNDLQLADAMLIIGNMNPHGSLRPESIVYKSTSVLNYTQIFRNPIDLTRHKRKARTRSVNPYDEARKDAFIEHSIEIEKALIWGEQWYDSNGTYSYNGQPESAMRGIVNWIKALASDNHAYFNLETDEDYIGKTWAAAGYQWLVDQMEKTFKWTGGTGSKLVYCGTGALKALTRLAEMHPNSAISIESGQMEFGINIRKLISPFGIWNLQTHPLFSHEVTNTNNMLVVEPKNLEYVYYEGFDTHYVPQKGEQGEGGKDGLSEEFITECGIKLFFPNTFGYFGGVGLNNVLVPA